MRLSLRLPPTLNVETAQNILKEKLLSPGDDTYGAQVDLKFQGSGSGFNAPKLPEDLIRKFEQHHAEVFEGAQPMFTGIGGSIPFMEVFKKHFPESNFLLTGVGFPESNAHSANENLDLDYTRKFTTVISKLLSTL